MRAAEKRLIERNLDLIFEFEKYVLEHPEISEKIPPGAVVFMKVAGDKKFNHWSEAKAIFVFSRPRPQRRAGLETYRRL